MPAKFYQCPGNKPIEITQCLTKCQRFEGRCLSLPTLTDIGTQREWHGKPSTTQLLNPTRLAYLRITCDYTIDPQGMAFALLGTRHHRRLDVVAKRLEMLSEEQIGDKEVSGVLDLLEPDENRQGFYKLIDYKTWGSYAVAKQLGLYDNGDAEQRQTALQLNRYRLFVEDLGFNISQLLVQCTVRDGGTKSSKINGIDAKLLFVPIKMLDNQYVREYFSQKRTALLTALDKQELPELCPFEERWSNRRCKGFCEVAEFCPEGRQMNRMDNGKAK